MENTSEDEAVIIRNLKDSAALLPRIAALRQVLRQLRMALRQERENLSKEINTIKWLEVGKMKKKFILEDESKPFPKNRHHGLWLAQICSQRFSDSAICNDAMYRASRFHLERPHHIVGILEPSNDLRFSTNFTAVFPIVGKRTPILTH
ncbi:hypothetical protein HZH68_008429 [Vespula germanica]|uniref:Uncharacterized protein n=1 Tax=Vespula germanica TaxID=30212 RepID=A0A834JZA7_VESGE|nr:hypothetical protein HZH68_008429 [Vespula germanica]